MSQSASLTQGDSMCDSILESFKNTCSVHSTRNFVQGNGGLLSKNTQGSSNSIISNIDNIIISYKNTCYLKPMNRLRESITLLIE